MSRPASKVGGKKIPLYLSQTARDYLMDAAKSRQVSRTQIVEDLIQEADVAKKKTVVFVPAAAAPLGTKARGKKSSG